MKYIIKQSTIPAAILVIGPCGDEYCCYYMADDKPVTVGVTGSREQAEARFMALPMEVRAAVNKQFGIVFSLPYGQRTKWVDMQVPFEVEVNNENQSQRSHTDSA